MPLRSKTGPSGAKKAAAKPPVSRQTFAPSPLSQPLYGGNLDSSSTISLGPLNDGLEKHADSIADLVTRQKPTFLPHASPPEKPVMPSRSKNQKSENQNNIDGDEKREEEGKGSETLPFGIMGASGGGGGEDENNPANRNQNKAVSLNSFFSNRIRIAMAAPGFQVPLGFQLSMEKILGASLEHVRLHNDAESAKLNEALGSRAFALGSRIFFGNRQYSPHTVTGHHLLAHELAHIFQEGKVVGESKTTLRRAPHCGERGSVPVDNTQETLEEAQEEDIYEAENSIEIPDDTEIDEQISWPRACELNFEWWGRLQLQDVIPFRSYNPDSQPRAFANKTIAAQRLMFDNGVRIVEGAPLGRDGIFGPRTFLALYRVAADQKHAARAALQGLGLDLDSILKSRPTSQRAKALIIKPEFLIQFPIRPLGESVIRYYDDEFGMVFNDRQVLDYVLFDSEVPEGVTREDRIELLKRLYGQEENRLHGTVALVRVDRGFIHTEIDVGRAVNRDRRARIEQQHYFSFVGFTPERVSLMDRMFGLFESLLKAGSSLSTEKQQEIVDALDLLAQQGNPSRASEPDEIVAFLMAVYLPAIDSGMRSTVVEIYFNEKREKERKERESIETHNREVAHDRANALVTLIDQEDAYGPLRHGQFMTQLNLNLRDRRFFHLVLDDLSSRNKFVSLFDEVEGLKSQRALAALMELVLAGSYASHSRVQQSLRVVNERYGEERNHAYTTAGGGAVLLRGSERVGVGQVVGEVNAGFLRDETKERLKPAAQEKLETELERESREYMTRLMSGNEQSRSQDEAGEIILQQAWQAAGLDPDSDVESVEVMESLRVYSVRQAEPQPDGIERYDVQYEIVERLVTDDTDTGWVGKENTLDWRSESEFENQLFWYNFSQSADVIEAGAIVVSVAAVVIVAWEVGAIALLVEAAGGPAIVTASIGISVGIYMLTHERWTLEGLLLAGLEGYLGALGFRLFAPVGSAAGRLVIPATLEQITMRRAFAAWLVRHGVQGALTGGTVGPSMLFARDLIRVASEEGDFSTIGEYLRTAALGMVLGAVFEIGGSAVLAPIFRAADSTVLASLTEVVGRLRGEGIAPSLWMAEATGALSNFRAWMSGHWDDAIANGMYRTIREKVKRVGDSYLRGARLTLQRQVFELTETQLTREAVDGLERLLATNAIPDNTLINLLRHVNRTPERVVAFLQFMNGIDDVALNGLITRNQLRGLADSPETMALAMGRTPAEVSGLLTGRFNNQLGDLENFAGQVRALDSEISTQVLEALRTRGTGVTPNSLLRLTNSGAGLGDEMLEGLERILQRADSADVDGVLAALPDNEVANFLTKMRTASTADLDTVNRMLSDFGPNQVAWASPLPIADADALLTGLSPNARTAITDIPVTQAQELQALVGLNVLNDALTNGAAHGLRGSHLQTLRGHFHEATVKDFITFHSQDAGKMRRVFSMASNLDAAAARVSAGPNLGANTLVLDSNTMFAIEELMRGTPFASLTPNRQDVINGLRGQRGLGAYADPPAGASPDLDHIVGPNADLRSPTAVNAEAVRGEAHVGPSPVLDEFTGITPGRSNPDYGPVITELEGVSVGGNKGAVDRSIIADAIFSQRDAGVTPTLVTGDRGILERLAEEFAVSPVPFNPVANVSRWTQLVDTYPGGQFTIDILGHRLLVVFRGATP